MKLSIITINYNNCNGLERTIRSVVEQSVLPYEYIVVDGGSTDGGVEILQMYEQNLTCWVSEPDNGLYAALNKGTRMATGDYCLYLNSGDTFFSKDVIARLNTLHFSEDFIEGRANTENGISTPPAKYTLGTFLYYRNPYHQACLIKRSMALNRPYDESYRIAGDLAFNINNLVIHACSYRPLDIIICNYEPGGRSATIRHQDEIDRAYSTIPIRIMEDFQNMRWFYQFPMKQLQPIMHALVRSVLLYRCKLFIKNMMGKPIAKLEYRELQDRINKQI